MLAEFSIYPMRAEHMSRDVAKVIETLEGMGLKYHLGPMSTAVEGSWEQVIDVAQKCHAAMRKKTERVVTFMKVDDYAERTGRLTGAVASVEAKVGKAVKK